MSDWSNGYKLIEYLLSLSDSKERTLAKLEWILDYIYYIKKWEGCETCSCGHYPIQEVCVIINIENNNTAIVWNVCVQKFVNQIDSWNIFDWLKRIFKNLSSWPSKELIEYSFCKWYINDWEYKFCSDRFGKKKFSWRQLKIRKKINQKILNQIIKHFN